MKKTLTGELTRLYTRTTIEHYEMILKEVEKNSVSISVVIDRALKMYFREPIILLKKVDRELEER